MEVQQDSRCGGLRDLVPFVQFKKRENTHGGVLILVKLQASTFFKFTNGIKPRNESQIHFYREAFR